MMDKSIPVKVLLVFFVVLFGVGVIAGFAAVSLNLWSNYKTVVFNQGYSQGKNDTISAVINKAQSSCKTMNLSLKDKKVGLINTQCLKQQGRNSSSSQSVGETSAEKTLKESPQNFSQEFKQKMSQIGNIEDCSEKFEGENMLKCKRNYVRENAENLDKSICEKIKNEEEQTKCKEFFESR